MGKWWNRHVTSEDRAEIWDQVASIRLAAGDLKGAVSANRLAQENRSLSR